jgi:asparagine synthetase A
MISDSIGLRYNKIGKKNEATIKEILQSQAIWKDINADNFPYNEAEIWFSHMKTISDSDV